MLHTLEVFVKLVRAAGDEVFTSGTQTIRKSVVGADAFNFMKAQAEQLAAADERIRKADERTAQATFMKRAGDEIPFIAGTVEERAAMLKGIDAMTDPIAKKAALTALEAANKLAKTAFSKIGKFGGDLPEGGDSAEAELNKLAKAAADAGKIPFAKAYDQVVAANPELYAKHKEEKRANAQAN